MKYAERIAICEACPHFTAAGTCGTPVIGQIIVEDGKTYKLCGCFMRIKAAVPFLSCPMGKWKQQDVRIPLLEYNEQLDYYLFLKRLNDSKTVTAPDNKRLTEIWNKLYPHNVIRPSSCPPCIQTTIAGLMDKLKPGLLPEDIT